MTEHARQGRSFSFSGTNIVACGTLRPELTRLTDDGRLNARRILYTAPGLHERQAELQAQLARQLERVASDTGHVVVVYGQRCFLDTRDPTRDTEAIIREAYPEAVRVGGDREVAVRICGARWRGLVERRRELSDRHVSSRLTEGRIDTHRGGGMTGRAARGGRTPRSWWPNGTPRRSGGTSDARPHRQPGVGEG